jgi:hypothetical protein
MLSQRVCSQGAALSSAAVNYFANVYCLVIFFEITRGADPAKKEVETTVNFFVHFPKFGQMVNKKFLLLILPVIMLLLLSSGFVVLLEFSSSSSVRLGSTSTVMEISTETATEYVTRIQTVQATSISIVPDPAKTIHVPQIETSTVTVTKVVTLRQRMTLLRNYILVGGQNGTWFTQSQYPRLVQIFSDSNSSSSVHLTPIAGKGTVWGGGADNFDWLISGWGIGTAGGKSNPYLFVYNGSGQVTDSIEDSPEAEWAGGDIFSISTNGTGWLLAGMGSGILNPHIVGTGKYRPTGTNHLSMGFFDGATFTDFSSKLPEQMDGILYANAYNGSAWLVGGGYLSHGVLFLFDGKHFVDLTVAIKKSIPSFASVQSVAWNGHYWLIGGVGFLAKLDGNRFLDLSRNLSEALPLSIAPGTLQSVNALSWNGRTWLIGGGEPVAIDVVPSLGWLALYNSSKFTDLSNQLPLSVATTNSSSSILTIVHSSSDGYWLAGGYSKTNHGMLLKYQKQEVMDLSNSTGDMSYVNWVAAT